MIDRSVSRSPTEILAAWRAAESRLAELEEGSPEWHRTRLAAEDLSRQYQLALAERQDVVDELRSRSATVERTD